MRIVFLNPSAHLGGAEACLLDILDGIRTARPDWSLHLVTGEDGPLLPRVRQLGISEEVLPFPSAIAQIGDSAHTPGAAGNATLLKLAGKLSRSALPVVRYRRALRQLLSSLRPDLIHTNGFKMHLLGLWSRPGAVPVVWHVHDYVSSRPLMARLFRPNVSGCAAVIANSQSVAADIRKLCGPQIASALTLRTIYNAVDLERFHPNGPAANLDALCGFPPAPAGAIHVGLVATMAWWKGHRLFIEAVSRLPRHLPIRAFVIGGPVYRTQDSQLSLAELRTHAASLAASDRIGFPGFLEDSASALRALDVVVHASTQPEPFGRVIMEAMACGRPVLTSGIGGSAEILDMGPGAIKFQCGNADDLAAGIASLAEDSNLRRALGAAGRKTAESNFQRDLLARYLVPLYGSIAASSVPATEPAAVNVSVS
ncbi:MAG TPA: glycosyltransferase family 4 protein [Terriglobales bacterium]|nr:glycosyltransferase family 4 protein [Terriglobales bacterium]